MREIKFRAWNGKEMFDVDVLAISPVGWDSGGTGVSLAYQPHIKVMQYTGLKDINGTKIYEDDIDIDVDNGNLSVVKYLEKYGAYCFVPAELYLHEDYEKEVTYQHGYDCYFHNVTPSKYAKIIGNIHEHPYLLEGEAIETN